MKNSNNLSFNSSNRENTIRPRSFKSPFNKNSNAKSQSNFSLMDFLFRWKWIILFLVVIILILGISLGVGLKEKFISQIDEDNKDMKKNKKN